MKSLEYLTQIVNDFVPLLPASARGPVSQAAQAAINDIRDQLAPKPEPKEVE